MKDLRSVLTAITLVASAAAAPLDTAIVNAMKLTEAKSYAWTTTVDDDARSYTIDGRTIRASDLSLVSMPLAASLRRHLPTGTANSDNQASIAFLGAEKYAVQTAAGWKTADEITALPAPDRRGPTDRGSFGGGGFGGGGGAGGGMRGSRGKRGSGGGLGGEEGDGRAGVAYSNLQTTLSRPHEEIAIIVVGHTQPKVEGSVLSGTLTETAAKLLLVHPGQREVTPVEAHGTFRFIYSASALTKYEVKLEGRIAVQTNYGRREIVVHQTAVTELRAVDTATFDLPAEAKVRLGL